MQIGNFVDLTGYMPTDEEYLKISQAYNLSKKSEHQFCREWVAEHYLDVIRQMRKTIARQEEIIDEVQAANIEMELRIKALEGDDEWTDLL